MPVIVADTAIDTGLVTELLSLVKSCMGLFSEYPLNLLLIASLAGVGFWIFGRAKRAAH